MSVTDTQTPDAAWQAKHEAILEAAYALFAEKGYAGTSMKELAERAGCSVGYLYKHFPGKQEILDTISARQLDAYEDMRRTTRTDASLTPVGCLVRELELVCRHLLPHRALIPVYQRRAPEQADWMRERLVRIRREDEALLEKARQQGEIPGVDPVMLAAALDGAVWGLLNDLAVGVDDEAFLQIPQLVDELILAPLRQRGKAA